MFRVTFHITEECNMACTYCYEFKKNKVIQLGTATKFIDEIISYKTGNNSFLGPYFETSGEILTDTGVELDFIGGEITLYMDLVKKSLTEFISNVLLKILPIGLYLSCKLDSENLKQLYRFPYTSIAICTPVIPQVEHSLIES